LQGRATACCKSRIRPRNRSSCPGLKSLRKERLALYENRNSHAEDEDQERRGEAFQEARQRQVQAQQRDLRHILTKKSTKRKRHLRGTVMAHSSDKNALKAMLPY